MKDTFKVFPSRRLNDPLLDCLIAKGLSETALTARIIWFRQPPDFAVCNARRLGGRRLYSVSIRNRVMRGNIEYGNLNFLFSRIADHFRDQTWCILTEGPKPLGMAYLKLDDKRRST